jgi:hypothetical protein
VHGGARHPRATEQVELLEKEKRAAARAMVGKHGERCMQVARIDRHGDTQARSAWRNTKGCRPACGSRVLLRLDTRRTLPSVRVPTEL